jgi:hypothetical protein
LHRWALLLAAAHERSGCGGARHRAPFIGQGIQRSWRRDLRGRLCAADVADVVVPGAVKSFEASAEYQPVYVNGEWVDVGGSLNTLTPSRSQQQRTSSMSPNSCLVQVEPWDGIAQIAKMRLR